MFKKVVNFLVFCVLILFSLAASAAPVTFTDSTGHSFAIQHVPQRVVCLVPSVTEMIFRIGAGREVAGVTYHSTTPPAVSLKPVVGGFFSPSLERIAALHPDMIFASRIQKNILKRFRKTCPVVVLEANSVADIYRHLKILGEIFHREESSRRLIRSIKAEFALLKKKTDRIPLNQRKRVIRVMGREKVMAPGDNSFQNEYIRLAGGIPPVFGKKGPIVVVTKKEWERFNPQVIYGCGGDHEVVKKILSQPGWRDVDAVKNKAIYFFPCALTCRVSTHAAYFAAWLSSDIYGKLYVRKSGQVIKDHEVWSKPVPVAFRYVKSARIIGSRIADFLNKTLLISFTRPMRVLSTLEGSREGITTVGNHYMPPQVWNISYLMGFRNFLQRVYDTLDLRKKRTSLLMTGADMDNLSVQTRKYRAITVTAMVTAGVRSNAMRMSKDIGKYYEPGTINIILMTNCHLTQRAMARAVITATEAKTAALEDLDIRSAYTGRRNQATGTGTDNVLVVQGEGARIDNAGGHTRMGTLIAEAVYRGVRQAIFKQNGIVGGRNVFQRLKERHLALYDLIPDGGLGQRIPRMKAVADLESLLLQPKYAAFIETAFAISDQYEAGLIHSLSPYRLWCKEMVYEISGRRSGAMKNLVNDSCKLPPVLRMALNALLNGICDQP